MIKWKNEKIKGKKRKGTTPIRNCGGYDIMWTTMTS